MIRKCVLLIVVLLLAGCEQQANPSTNNVPTTGNDNAITTTVTPTAASTATASPTISPTSTTQPQAEGGEFAVLMDSFFGLLRQQDSEGLLDFLLESDEEYYKDYLDLDAEDIKTIIKLLAYDIDLETVYFELAESEPAYAMYTAVGKKGELDVSLPDLVYIEKTDEKLRLNWTYLRYLPYTESMANEYVRLVKLGDPQELAYFMSVDDLLYTEENAEKIISIYNVYFADTDSLQLVYNGNFEFMVSDKQGNDHSFTVIYGDGLMGIRDTFAPEQT